MTTPSRPESDRIDVDLEEILTDAYGEDEQLWALLDAISEGLELPVDVTVVGQAFSLVEVDYDGKVRRGIMGRCVDGDGREHQVSLAAVRVARGVSGEEYLTAYRRWLGGNAASE